MLKKKVIALGAVAIAASLLAAPSANAGAKPASKANVGDECFRAGAKAPGRGVNGNRYSRWITTLVVSRDEAIRIS